MFRRRRVAFILALLVQSTFACTPFSMDPNAANAMVNGVSSAIGGVGSRLGQAMATGDTTGESAGAGGSVGPAGMVDMRGRPGVGSLESMGLGGGAPSPGLGLGGGLGLGNPPRALGQNTHLQQGPVIPGASLTPVPIVDTGELFCYDFDAKCRWKNMEGLFVDELDWYQGAGFLDKARLQVATGTNIAPDGPYAIVATDKIELSVNKAILVSDPVACQKGPGEIRFLYWSSPEVRIRVCAKRQRKLFPDYDHCSTAIEGGDPGPAYVAIPDMGEEPFQLYIIAENFVFRAPNLQGGFAIVDNIEYYAEMCSMEEIAGGTGSMMGIEPLLGSPPADPMNPLLQNPMARRQSPGLGGLSSGSDRVGIGAARSDRIGGLGRSASERVSLGGVARVAPSGMQPALPGLADNSLLDQTAPVPAPSPIFQQEQIQVQPAAGPKGDLMDRFAEMVRAATRAGGIQFGSSPTPFPTLRPAEDTLEGQNEAVHMAMRQGVFHPTSVQLTRRGPLPGTEFATEAQPQMVTDILPGAPVDMETDNDACAVLNCTFARGQCLRFASASGWQTSDHPVGNPLTGIRGDASQLPFNRDGSFAFVSGPKQFSRLTTPRFELDRDALFVFAFHKVDRHSRFRVYARRADSDKEMVLFEAPQITKDSRRWFREGRTLLRGRYQYLAFEVQNLSPNNYIGIDETMLLDGKRQPFCRMR